MTKSTTITINGRLYDAITGMPVRLQASAPAASNVSSGVAAKPKQAFNDIGPRQTTQITQAATANARLVHQRLQRSQTLNRQAIQKPVAPAVHTQRSPLITRHRPVVIAPAQVAAPQVHSQPAAQTTHLHPTVAKVLQKQAAKQLAEQPRSSKELKEMLIKERLAEVSDAPKKAPRKNFFSRQPRLTTILASTLSLLLLGGYLTFINLSNISMRVAASKAGINANFPNYKPDGYGLNGPITYTAGEVTVSYKSNTNDNNFRLTQRATNWDSQAVLDNYVSKHTDTYLTFLERGVTIYTFSSNAAWSNGGILYTIDGNANLSSDQVLRIATSL